VEIKNTIGGKLRCASVNNFVQVVPLKQLPMIIVFTMAVEVNNPPVLKHFPGFNDVVLLVVGDVPVSEAPMVTLSISRIFWPSLQRFS
jgi:hypothetical protein